MFSKQSIMQATVVLSFFAVVSGVLGYAREGLVAYQFGPGASLDAYLAAFLIPTLFVNILNATLPYAFINIFNRMRVETGENEAWWFAGAFLKRILLLLLFLSAASAAFALPLMKLVAPGFTQEQFLLARRLFLILAPTFVFSGLFIYATALLQSYRHFIWPAILNLSINLFPIAAVWFWGRRLGIITLAVGVLLGFAVQSAIMMVLLARRWPRHAEPVRKRELPMAEWSHFILPIFLLFVLDQINLLLTRHFASFLEEGSMSMLYFSSIIVQLIMMVIILPACRALYPDLTLSMAGGETGVVREKIIRTINLFMLITIPIVAGLVILRHEIIQLLFERGAFEPRYTAITAAIFMYYALAFLPVGLGNIFLVVFFTLRRAWVPVITTVGSITLYILLAKWLMPSQRVVGLAMANLVATTLYAGSLLWYIHRRVFQLTWKDVFRPAVGMMLLGLLMALSTLGIRTGWSGGWLRLPLLVMLVLNIAASALVYVGLGVWFKNSEVLYWLGRVRQIVLRLGGG